MKRTTALLFALALLVAHALTIDQDPLGLLGTVADRAYVAMRMARNLVHEGSPAWNVGLWFEDGYPSWPWWLACAVAERVYWPSLWTLQLLGAAGGLGLVAVVARFSPARLAGVIAPFLVVVSGTLAAATLSGTEWTVFALATTAAVLGQEEREPRWLAAGLVAAALLRPEGLLVVVALWALARTLGPAPIHRWPYLWGAAAGLGLAGLRALVSGRPIPPELAPLLEFDGARLADGAQYVGSFLTRAGTPLLTAVAVAFVLLRRRRGARTLRLLLLAGAWLAYVANLGGDELPFWLPLLPALPLLAVAVQEALTSLVDSRSQGLRALGWALFLFGLSAGALASKLPADVGLLPLGRLQLRWMGGEAARVSDDLDVRVARVGQQDHLLREERLRCVGLFARDHLPSQATLLSPWPGAIGYLSRRAVFDLGQRVGTPPGQVPRPWWGPGRGDVLAALEREPDYIVPSLQLSGAPLSLAEVREEWLARLDSEPSSATRRAAIEALFARYVPIAVPVPAHSRYPQLDAPEPYVLLRHERLGQSTDLRLMRDGQRFTVELAHRGHRQISALEVRLSDDQGRHWWLRPTGEFVLGTPLFVRPRLLIYPSGHRAVQLLEATLPAEVSARQLGASLRLPGSQADPAPPEPQVLLAL